jgi:malate dehydrogenase (oxaloacetate-decarboxylating)(NADP+)
MKFVDNEILHNPELNKSTAFTQEERKSNNLEGLIPDTIETLELQIKRVLMQLSHKERGID